MTTENEINPELESACRSDLEKLSKLYGIGVIDKVFAQIKADSPDIASSLTSEEDRAIVENLNERQEISTDLAKLQEILQRPDLPIHIQTVVQKGEKFLGQMAESSGFQFFDINRDKMSSFFSEHPTRDKQNLDQRCSVLLEQARSTVPFEKRNHSLQVIALNNLDTQGTCALGLEFKSTRTDEFKRPIPVTIYLILSPGQSDEIVEILKRSDCNQALDVIQGRVSPDFNSVTPHEEISELCYGQLTLNPGEDWQSIDRKRIPFQTTHQ